jgi:hypothetical protein
MGAPRLEKNRPNGRTSAEIDRAELERRMERPLHFGCSLCPWTFDGPLREGKAEAADHRAREHPELRPHRRRRAPQSPHIVRRPALTEEEVEEINLERRRRSIETGVMFDV